MMSTERPKVGIGIFVLKEGKILLHKRKGAHGEGCWSLPGGHLEFKESIYNGALREVKEEFGVKVKNPRFVCITNDIFEKEGKHYITIYVATDYASGQPRIMEKEWCTEISWSDINNLPKPLFIPLKNPMANKCFPENWRDNI